MNQYSQRLATSTDKYAIAPLWRSFVEERVNADPSIILKPDFDFERYVEYQLEKNRSYCFVLEYQENIVGFLATYVYDETPPANLAISENPFIPRRVGTVLGLYVQQEHRKPETIKCLIDAAINLAEDLKITDIDLLISTEQTGIHALLDRLGFTKAAIQYTKHFESSGDNLPNLSVDNSKREIDRYRIPLRDPKTNELVKNQAGEVVYLSPIRNEQGEIFIGSSGLPIYPTPLRDPQTQAWVFDEQGNLVVCPVILDDNQKVVEYQNIPQFYRPLYEKIEGKLQLKRDIEGQYLFAEVERDELGKVKRSPDGQPIFKS